MPKEAAGDGGDGRCMEAQRERAAGGRSSPAHDLLLFPRLQILVALLLVDRERPVQQREQDRLQRGLDERRDYDLGPAGPTRNQASVS